MIAYKVRPFILLPLLPFLLTVLASSCQGSDQKCPADVFLTPKEPNPGMLAKPSPPVAANLDKDEKNVLYPGQSLWAGGSGLLLGEAENEFGFRLTADGNLILYNSDKRLWTAKTEDTSPGYELIMQDDGNLVLYNHKNTPVWSSKTHAYYGGEKYRTADWRPVKLVLEPKLLVLYSATGRKVWNNEVGEIGDPK